MPNSIRKVPKTIRKDVLDYLSHLNKDTDFPEIKNYLKSPFFEVESRKKVIQLFELLIRHHPNYKKNAAISNSLLNKKMGITYVANLKSTLVDCIEDYLRIKRLKENENWNILLLAESLDKLNMHKQLIRIINNDLTILKNKEAYTEHDYYLKYQLLFIKHKNLQNDKNKIKDTSLEEAVQTLTYYYLYSNLIKLIANKMESIIFKRETNVSLAENMINSVLNYQNILDPNITISYFIFKYFDLNDIKTKKETYFIIKKIVNDQWNKLNPFNRHEIYLNTINIISNIMSDGVDFEKEKFKIHKFWIDKNVHKFYNDMDTALFMSIVVSASTVGKFKWCKNFIHENTNMLIDSEKNETISYCEAYIFFRQNKYDDSLKLLNTIKFSNPLFELNLKMLEIKCLYEKKSSYRFNIYIKNIKNFITRHKRLADRKKSQHLNAIKYLVEISKARFTKNFNKLKLLRKDINDEAVLNSKIWLVNKIDELIENS